VGADVDLEALIAACDDDPEDEARVAVLADALVAAGDPRGELILLQRALARAPTATDRELERAEQLARRALWPELARFRDAIIDARWRRGFVDELEVDGNYRSAIGEAVRAAGGAASTRRLRSLKAKRWAKRDGDPRALAGLPDLRSVAIEDAEAWTEDDAMAVASLPRVESFTIGRCALGAGAIAGLAAGLRGLGLENMRELGDDHVAAATARPALRRLRLHKTAVTDACGALVGDSVRDLDLSLCQSVTSGVFRQLGTRVLETLRIVTPSAHADGAELAHLRRGSLEDLSVSSVANADAALAAMARQPTLRSLWLVTDGKPFEGDTLVRVLALPALRRLDLLHRGTIAGTGAISASGSSVERMQLHVGAPASAFVASLPAMPLVELDLHADHQLNRWVGDDTLAVLATCARLEDLKLYNTNITDAGLAELRALRQLKTLSLGYCKQITRRAAVELAWALPGLRKLVLDSTTIDSLAGLEHHPTLAELHLQHTAIGAADLAIAATMPNLRSLNIGWTKIGDADLEALLPAAPTLRHLDLGACKGITKAATDVLRQFDALETVNLRFAPIGEPSANPRDSVELRAALPTCRFEW
jgi:hypothetical protein